MRRRTGTEGFTTVELMIVALIIGIIVSVAVPLYLSSTAAASQKVCFGNQREIDGAAAMWLVREPDNEPVELAGVIGAAHPLITDRVLTRPPRCTAAPEPDDPADPSAEEGAYSIDGNGAVQTCTFGVLAPHGRYQ